MPEPEAEKAPEKNSAFYLVQTARERTQRVQERYDSYWQSFKGKGIGPTADRIREFPKAWLEVGAGTGDFFMEMARQHPDTLCIAVERDRMRGKALVRRGKKVALPNLLPLRGNVIPTLIGEIPDEALEKIFVLYPCPWPKQSQRKNRWYNHPMMAHMVRTLTADGRLIWASDQKFFIDECRFACETYHGLEVVYHGEVARRPDNGTEFFPKGRTKFETTFQAEGQPCYELILKKRTP